MTQSSLSPSPSGVSSVNGLAFIERDGEILFTSEEIGCKLGFKHPTKSVNVLYNRNQKELQRYSVDIKLMSTDGKYYKTRAFTEEGAYLLIMRADTPKAASCRALFASVLRQVREQRLELAHQSGYAQGLAEGQSAPAVQVAVKRAYLDGLTEGQGEAEKLKGYYLLASRCTNDMRHILEGLTTPVQQHTQRASASA